jgi:(p)ppGpp synthase/HD superfamily hydrolase
MENKETFRARIKPVFSPNDQLDINLAYVLAKFGHRAQIRKELTDGKPTRYFEHPRRVAIILMDEMKLMNRDMIISCLLHDALEDTEDITAELLQHSFGNNVATIVTLLSKKPKEGYHDRLYNCTNWQVWAVKACDRLDNLRSLMVPGTSIEFQKKQIKETKEIYFPLFEKLLDLQDDRLSQSDKKNIRIVVDEIKRLVERYSTIIELQEGK